MTNYSIRYSFEKNRKIYKKINKFTDRFSGFIIGKYIIITL
jgi:hypothetical protein